MQKTLPILAAIGMSVTCLQARAKADPATMLIIPRSDTNPIVVLQFPSLVDCDAAADHLAKVRTPNRSTLGVPGAWKANFKQGSDGLREDPRLATICLPSTAEIPGVAATLTEKGWYRDIYK